MPVTQHEIFLMDTGERYRCRSDQTVLAGMETLGRHGIPVGCRQGGCGVCKVEVLSGQFTARPMSQDHVSREDAQAGRVLACRIYPRSDLTIRVLGKMKKTVCAPPAIPRQAAEQT